MKKQHKKYKRPKKTFDKGRIDEENALIKEYGLKNKKEIWKATSYIEKLRGQAKKLLVASAEEQETFLGKLANLGLISKEARIDDVLSLTNVDIFRRRLQTVLVKKNFAHTPREARQMVTHKHVIVKNNVINIPSYIVPIDMESEIKIKKKKTKPKQKKAEQPKLEQPVEQQQPAQEEAKQ